MGEQVDAQESFETWYQVHYRSLLAAMTLAARDVHVGGEVTDEAFARAFERWSRVSGMDSPVGWTYAVALNVLRRRQRRQAIERRLLARPPDPVAPLELSVEVWDAVAALGPRARQAVALRYLMGLREVDVAAVMGVKAGTVARMLHDARGQLAARLGDDEPSPRGAASERT